MDWLLTAVGAMVAGIVGAAMLAVGGCSTYHAVRMNPTNPRRAEIRCFANVWQMPLTFVGLAAMLGLVLWFFGLP
jgi:hypothetical protein